MTDERFGSAQKLSEADYEQWKNVLSRSIDVSIARYLESG